ncbi:B-cell lymphoma 3 protein [Mactra antiquata]
MGTVDSRVHDRTETVNSTDGNSRNADDTNQTSNQTGSACDEVKIEHSDSEESEIFEGTVDVIRNGGINDDESDIDNVLGNDLMNSDATETSGTNSMDSGWNILSRVKTAINQFGTWRNTGLYDDVKTEEPVRNFNNNVEDIALYNNINVRYSNGWSPLTAAIRTGNIERVNTVLQHPDVNVEFREVIPRQLGNYREPHKTPLIVAILEGKREMVKLLLEAGADVNTKDEEQYSALYHAVNNNLIDIVELLLDYKPTLCTDETYRNPLYIACQHNRIQVMKLILSAGYRLDESHSSLLPVAIESMSEEIALYLIEMGIPLTSNNKIKAPLISACQHGYLSIVETCTEAGCDINMTLANGVCPLQAAIKLCNFQWEKVLLYGKCSDNPNQLTPEVKHYLRQRQQIVDLLCSKGCRLNDALKSRVTFDQKSHKITALANAIRCDNLLCVYVLIKHGAEWDENCHRNLIKCYEDWTKKTHKDSYMELMMELYLSKIVQMLRHKDMMRFLHDINQQEYTPPSLKDSCRHVIRDQLMKDSNTTILPRISMLNLPKLLQQYLCFQDFNELENCLT